MADHVDEFLFRGAIPEENRGNTFHVVINIGTKLVGPMPPELAASRGWPLPAILADINAQAIAELNQTRAAVADRENQLSDMAKKVSDANIAVSNAQVATEAARAVAANAVKERDDAVKEKDAAVAAQDVVEAAHEDLKAQLLTVQSASETSEAPLEPAPEPKMNVFVKYRNTVVNVVATAIALAIAVGLLQPSAAETPAQVAANYDQVVSAVGVVIAAVNAVLHMFPDASDKAKSAQATKTPA